MLDGAPPCRITLKGKQDGHEVKDMSSIADTNVQATETEEMMDRGPENPGLSLYVK